VRGAPNQNNIASVHPKPIRIFFHANALLFLLRSNPSLVEYFRSPTIIIPTRETFFVLAAQPCCTSPGPMRHAGSRMPRLLLPTGTRTPRLCIECLCRAYVALESRVCRVVPVLSPAHPHVIHRLSQLLGPLPAFVPTRFTGLIAAPMSYTLRSTGTMQVPIVSFGIAALMSIRLPALKSHAPRSY